MSTGRLFTRYSVSDNQVVHEVTSWMILIGHEAILLWERPLPLIFKKTITEYSIPVGKLGTLVMKKLKNCASLIIQRSRF